MISSESKNLAEEYSRILHRKIGSHVKQIFLFGSHARGDAWAGSDYDMLVIVDKRTPDIREKTLDIAEEMMNKYEKLFSTLIYDEDEWQKSARISFCLEHKAGGNTTLSGYKPTPDTLKAMLKKAQEKLEVAKKDFESGYFGDSSSRAYYAVFHAISADLAERGLTFASHAQTIGAFNREFIKERVFPSNTFRKIQRLFENRQMADYDWNFTFEKDHAEEDITDAEWLVNE